MTSAKDRIIAELKQSPGKAAVLGLGVVAAAIVWGGQLSGASSRNAKERTAAAPDVMTGAMEADANAFRSDPEAIREEFERILEEARSLRRFAETIRPADVNRDPFVHDREDREVEPPVPIAPAPPPVDDSDLITDERARAGQVHVDGVFLFASTRRAVLDGVVCGIGDEHAGFVVVRIDGRMVTLRGTHSDHQLSMDRPKDDQ